MPDDTREWRATAGNINTYVAFRAAIDANRVRSVAHALMFLQQHSRETVAEVPSDGARKGDTPVALPTVEVDDEEADADSVALPGAATRNRQGKWNRSAAPPPDERASSKPAQALQRQAPPDAQQQASKICRACAMRGHVRLYCPHLSLDLCKRIVTDVQAHPQERTTQQRTVAAPAVDSGDTQQQHQRRSAYRAGTMAARTRRVGATAAAPHCGHHVRAFD